MPWVPLERQCKRTPPHAESCVCAHTMVTEPVSICPETQAHRSYPRTVEPGCSSTCDPDEQAGSADERRCGQQQPVAGVQAVKGAAHRDTLPGQRPIRMVAARAGLCMRFIGHRLPIILCLGCLPWCATSAHQHTVKALMWTALRTL